MTPCETWLDSCVLHQQTIYPSSRYSTSWASSERSHTVSSTPCHGAWTPTPLSDHLSIEWEYAASPIETYF